LFNVAEAFASGTEPSYRQGNSRTEVHSIQTNMPESCVGSKAAIFMAVKIHVPILCAVTTEWSSRSLFFIIIIIIIISSSGVILNPLHTRVSTGLIVTSPE
jgi:hypothetical protein